jgi:crotonobetaine/carnitine-CoA ligase
MQGKGANHVSPVDLHDRVIIKLLAERAKSSPDVPFLHIGGVDLTYGETYAQVQRTANGLAELGVQPGDRVVIMLSNRLEFLLSWFAPALMGATVVPINPDWKGDTLHYILSDAAPVVLITNEALVGTVSAAVLDIPTLKAVVVCDSSLSGDSSGPWRQVSWTEMLAEAPETRRDTSLSCYSDVFAILYSSGTTGRPKGIMLPNAHIYSFGINWIATTNLQQDDVLYAPLSLFYMQPMILGVVPVLMVGAQVHIAERFSATRYWADIRRTEATIAHGQFTLIPILLKEPPSNQDRQHRCTRVFIGKSNEDFETRFGVRLIEIYGSTESNLVTYVPWEEPRANSCGKAAPDFEVRIVDDDDRELPQGELGEIVFRPKEPYVISYGYLNQPGATLEAFRNLWFHLGDRGYQDKDGYFYFVDRKKDVIRRKGENISSQELERQVTAHPEVTACAVVPIPDREAEEEVKAFVVVREGAKLTSQELIDYLSSRLPRFMVPRYIEFVSSMPLTPSMKIEKFKLREIGLTAQTWDRQSGDYVQSS